MLNSQKIFETNDIGITTFNHEALLNQYKYYQVFTEDYWGLSTSSNIKRGCLGLFLVKRITMLALIMVATLSKPMIMDILLLVIQACLEMITAISSC